MPINREKGEIIEIFGKHDAVPKPEVFKEYLTQLRITIEKPRPGKWKPAVINRSILEDAAEKAAEAFIAAGAILPITFDDTSWVCQEYHSQGLVVLIAQHRIAGNDQYVILPYALKRGQVNWLVTTNRWKLANGNTLDKLERTPIVKEPTDNAPSRAHH